MGLEIGLKKQWKRVKNSQSDCQESLRRKNKMTKKKTKKKKVKVKKKKAKKKKKY